VKGGKGLITMMSEGHGLWAYHVAKSFLEERTGFLEFRV